MVFKMYFLFCTSAAPKSRVPLGKEGFCIAINCVANITEKMRFYMRKQLVKGTDKLKKIS